ncbi:MAG TPA: YncE family protein [Thermoanaerobaculia bacterium]|nr:YncE family protein [Thermoanaerobaculia bacterium]
MPDRRHILPSSPAALAVLVAALAVLATVAPAAIASQAEPAKAATQATSATSASSATPATSASPATPATPGNTAAAASAAAAPAGGGAAAAYRLRKTIPLGGDGGWDYLAFDSAARRLYVTRATRVIVLDPDTGKVVGEIPNLSGVHGVALAPDLGRGFISNGRADKVTVFDLKSLKVLAELKSTGQNPDAILYDPASHRVFAFNGRSGSATVYDAASGQVAATIPLGGKPEFAASDRKGSVFVNIEDKNELVAIDATKLAVVQRWPLAGCEEPSGLAIDVAHQRLVVGCGNETSLIVDSASGRVVARLPIGKGVDANGFDPGAGLGFASCGDGTLTVMREETPDRWTVAAKAATRQGARTMAVDERTHAVYLATAEFGPRPAPTAAEPRPRPPILPGSFVILVVGP